MNYKVISNNKLKTTTWQGGTTTELYIFPEDSNYQERNFEFRISTAQVNLEESDFTSLPNINRELMILDGSIEITHENHYSKKLNKFDTDSFKGDWETSSKGTCVDFNIMMKENYNGKIEVLSLKSNQKLSFTCINDFSVFYVNKGETSIEITNKAHLLKKGDVFVLIEKVNLEINSKNKCEILISKIDLK